ncbi:Hypothetical_protein [Hexamita inflata]|uniref:Hypothetical_protein n=1 Tax=Hexamita inflata TaxID=28002 RepID=A0AA86P699_9EUKA|nr:Hypothetical protein HINF_LOCUS14099 [Hexamita inflata]CAI9931190.1 Hypothetical protein HINF_LOCUS18835 [Hexamita inflata]
MNSEVQIITPAIFLTNAQSLLQISSSGHHSLTFVATEILMLSPVKYNLFWAELSFKTNVKVEILKDYFVKVVAPKILYKNYSPSSSMSTNSFTAAVDQMTGCKQNQKEVLQFLIFTNGRKKVVQKLQNMVGEGVNASAMLQKFIE